jgi:two-component system chemotaxis sensor kinase CheA
VVDELMGEFQTVIKPLGKIFSNLRGISGSTILGSGEVALILDVPSLVQQAVTRETQQISRKQANNPVTVQ